MNSVTTLSLQEKYKSPPIIIPYDMVDTKYCVFKLFYNDKYVVLMGKTLFRQIEIIRTNLAYYFGRVNKSTQDKSKSENDFCIKFYKYIKENPNGKFNIEILCSDQTPYKLLQVNQIALDQEDENCLNTNKEPELSKYIQTPPIYRIGNYKNYKHWINRGYYLNFRKWQYNRPTKPQEAPL